MLRMPQILPRRKHLPGYEAPSIISKRIKSYKLYCLAKTDKIINQNKRKFEKLPNMLK